MFKCEAVLFCVVDGQVHVDSENHGPSKPCGRAPATALTKSLEFLSIALSTYKGEGCAVLYAPEDVRDTTEEPFSIPFITHARSRSARGILAPGPGDEILEFDTPVRGERHIPTKQKMGVSNADRVRRWGAAHTQLKSKFAVGDARSRK